jgi:hypothetical protein
MARLVAPRPLSCHDAAFNKIRNIEIEPKKVVTRPIKKVRSKFIEMDDVFVMADLECTPVKKTEEPSENKTVKLRRRKSLPTMRRKPSDTYQTLPLPRKSKTTKSDSKMAAIDDLALSPTNTRKTSIIETMGATLGRKGSMRKAKVVISESRGESRELFLISLFVFAIIIGERSLLRLIWERGEHTHVNARPFFDVGRSFVYAYFLKKLKLKKTGNNFLTS